MNYNYYLKMITGLNELPLQAQKKDENIWTKHAQY